jgi:hypothetical protein
MNSIGQLLKAMGWDTKLRELARRVENNVPRHTEPDRFHEEKSEIRNELLKMSKGDAT